MFFGSYNGKTTFLFLSENIALIVSIVVAALIKVGYAGHAFDFRVGIGKALFAAIVFQVSLYFHDLYDLKENANRVKLIRRLASALLIHSVLLGAVYALFPSMMVTKGIWF